jgi:hypothetical protein
MPWAPRIAAAAPFVESGVPATLYLVKKDVDAAPINTGEA